MSRFNNKLSTSQSEGIFFVVLAMIIIYTVHTDTNNSLYLLLSIGIIFLVNGLGKLLVGTRQKIQILSSSNLDEVEKTKDSKAEKSVAEYFDKKNVKYIFHPKIKIPKVYLKYFNIPFKNDILHPDFFLPEYNVYVEYWGLIDDPRYKERSYDYKKRKYKENLIECIDLYPKNLENLDHNFTQKLMQLFKNRQGIGMVYPKKKYLKN